MTAPIHAVLDRICPDRVLTGIERIAVGNRKRTVRATFTNGPALAVQSVPNDRERLVTEGAVLRAIGDRTRVPVAPLVASGVFGGGSYLLTEWVEGVSLHEVFTALDRPARHAIAQALGRHLGTLHAAFEFDAFGQIVAVDAVEDAASIADATTDGELTVVRPASDWRAEFRDLIDEGLTAFHGPLADLEEPIRAAIDADLDSLPRRPTPRLFPWDYRPGNALVPVGNESQQNPSEPGHSAGERREAPITAILDWESPRTAHREFSLAKVEYLLADWYATDTDEAGLSSGTGSPDGPTPANDRMDLGPPADPVEYGRPDSVDPNAVRAAFYGGYRESCTVPDGYWDERRRLYRLGAIVRAAVDSRGAVTRPGYPMVDPERAARFHREHLRALL